MSFGKAPIELMPGAKNAVDVCLNVRAGESLALIADEISRSVAASLETAANARGAKVTGLLLEDLGRGRCKMRLPWFWTRWKPRMWEYFA